MKCSVCGVLLAESDNGLQTHMRRYHALHMAARHRKYTKAEFEAIVAKWEAAHPEYLVGPEIPDCQEGCVCHRCFQKRLDRLVATSEAALNDSGTNPNQFSKLAGYGVPERPSANGQYTIQHGYGSENE